MTPNEEMEATRDLYERGNPWFNIYDVIVIIGILALIGLVVWSQSKPKANSQQIEIYEVNK